MCHRDVGREDKKNSQKKKKKAVNLSSDHIPKENCK